ncbi:MAG: AI-2E family transporter [Opitutaceae bacterium]|jgi:predicted PurR-regulated permease PerM|nr:AI-2E family transporter [Opitutaceae bacterium]
MPATGPDDHRALLSAGQRRLIGNALTLFACTGAAVLLVLILMSIGRLLGAFSGVLWPVAIAGVMALILRPAVDAVEKRMRGRRAPAVAVLYALFAVLLAVALVLIVPPLAGQLLDFIAYLPDLWMQGVDYIRRHSPEWPALIERLRATPAVANALDLLQDGLGRLPALIVPSLKVFSAGVFSVISFATHFAVVPVYLFFFMLSRADPVHGLSRHLPFLKPSLRDDVVFLVREFINIVVSFFRGQFLIGIIMGALLAIGFTVAGLRFGLIIGLALGILNIVPYLGTIIGLAVTVPLAVLQPGGGAGLLALVLLVYVIVQCIEGWFLTPKIMGGRTGLHPAMIIFAIFFWGTAFPGIIGMVLAVPLTAFFATFWRLLNRKYFTNGGRAAAGGGHAQPAPQPPPAAAP